MAAALRLSTAREPDRAPPAHPHPPSDGVGLLSSILSHFAAPAPPPPPPAGGSQPLPPALARAPPRLLACTHFHELARPEVLPRQPQIAFYEMAVIAGESDGRVAAAQLVAAAAAASSGGCGPLAGSGGEPVFLYRVAPGHSAPSFGLHCARRCGVPEPLLARAAAVIAAAGAGAPAPRLALAPLVARDARYCELVRALAAVDLGSAEAAGGLLAAAAGVA